jgi:hypothetical protein
MTAEYETEKVHRLRLEVPESGIVTAESRLDFASVTWPTELDPLETLQKLRRAMRIGSDIVSLYLNSAGILPSLRLGGMKSLEPSTIDDLGDASIFDDPTGSRVVWQRTKQHDHFEAGISGRQIDKKRLSSSLMATGNLTLKSQVDELTETILEKIHNG